MICKDVFRALSGACGFIRIFGMGLGGAQSAGAHRFVHARANIYPSLRGGRHARRGNPEPCFQNIPSLDCFVACRSSQ
jgi:hypothetical protein